MVELNIEIPIMKVKKDENITMSQKLEIISERFDMNKKQTLEFILNEIYQSDCLSQGLTKAMELIENYDDKYGDSYVSDELSAKEYSQEPPF